MENQIKCWQDSSKVFFARRSCQRLFQMEQICTLNSNIPLTIDLKVLNYLEVTLDKSLEFQNILI